MPGLGGRHAIAPRRKVPMPRPWTVDDCRRPPRRGHRGPRRRGRSGRSPAPSCRVWPSSTSQAKWSTHAVDVDEVLDHRGAWLAGREERRRPGVGGQGLERGVESGPVLGKQRSQHGDSSRPARDTGPRGAGRAPGGRWPGGVSGPGPAGGRVARRGPGCLRWRPDRGVTAVTGRAAAGGRRRTASSPRIDPAGAVARSLT